MFYNKIDKLIYTCPVNNIKYDPLALYRKLIAINGGAINRYLPTWTDDNAKDYEKALAEEEIVKIARIAFDCKPFTDPNGHLDGQVLTALIDFLNWIEKNG